MPLGMDGPPFQGFLQTLSPSRQPQTFESDCLTQPVPGGLLPPCLLSSALPGPLAHIFTPGTLNYRPGSLLSQEIGFIFPPEFGCSEG